MADETKTERDDEVEGHRFEEQAELNQAELNRLEEGPDVEGHRFEEQLTDQAEGV